MCIRDRHHAILNSCKYLEELGYEVTYLDVDEYGMVSPEAVYHAIREDTTLITMCIRDRDSRFFQTIILTVDTGMDTAWDKGKGEHSKERRAPLITKPGNSNKIRIMIEKKAAECGLSLIHIFCPRYYSHI